MKATSNAKTLTVSLLEYFQGLFFERHGIENILINDLLREAQWEVSDDWYTLSNTCIDYFNQKLTEV